jgi:hypothetical protein
MRVVLDFAGISYLLAAARRVTEHTRKKKPCNAAGGIAGLGKFIGLKP